MSISTGGQKSCQSLQVAKNQILMSSSDTHMFIDNVQECNYDEFSNDHVVIFIDHFLTMFFAFYIVIFLV
jgi:hypothetical protein